jgi:hypothetical protein
MMNRRQTMIVGATMVLAVLVTVFLLPPWFTKVTTLFVLLVGVAAYAIVRLWRMK